MMDVPQSTTGAKREQGVHHMAISRRDVLLGSAGALGAASFSFPAPAIAQTEPIKIGCLAAMTGPSSAPTIGFNRGVNFAVDAINKAGGVKGRKIMAAPDCLRRACRSRWVCPECWSAEAALHQ